jgi:serine protease inhibitor
MRKDQSLVARLAAGAGAVLIAAGLIADAAMAEPDMSKEVRVAEKMNELGGKTLSALTGRRNDASVIISPYGLGSALHLLMLGANDDSEAEKSLRKSLVPESITDLNKARDVLQAVNKSVLSASTGDKVTLKSVSAVYVPQGVTVSGNFRAKSAGVITA